jgi:sugar phosphate isomerase/epimerase
VAVLLRVGFFIVLAACSSAETPARLTPSHDGSAGAAGTTGTFGAAGSGGDAASSGASAGGSGGAPDAAIDHEGGGQVAAVGTYNFTLENRPVPDQIALLAGNGYRHLSFWWEPQGTIALADFLADERVRNRTLPVLAVLFAVDASQTHDVSRTRAVVDALAGRGIVLWLLLRGQIDDSIVIRVVREVADIAVSSGVRVVLYPHQGDVMADAEDALRIQRAAERTNVGISLHLCHELKAGNRDRLSDVIDKVVSAVDIATINGADTDIDARSTDWSQTIKPLDAGDFDVENNYFVPLWRAGYRGPLVLHTYGITDPPEEHLRRSAERFRSMAARAN